MSAGSTDQADGTRSVGDAANTQTIADRLRRDPVRRHVMFSSGVFLSVGVGYGLTVFLVSNLTGGPTGLGSSGLGGSGLGGPGAFAGLALFFGVVLAPLTAAVTGLVTGLRTDDDAVTAALAGGVGGGVGLVTMFASLLLVVSLATDAGSAGGDTTVGALLGLVLGVGATGAMAAYATRRLVGGDQ